MTLNTYSPDQMDKLVLRFFDLAAQLRNISRLARKYELYEFPVHDRKAVQWCDNLDIWVQKTEMNFNIVLQEALAQKDK